MSGQERAVDYQDLARTMRLFGESLMRLEDPDMLRTLLTAANAHDRDTFLAIGQRTGFDQLGKDWCVPFCHTVVAVINKGRGHFEERCMPLESISPTEWTGTFASVAALRAWLRKQSTCSWVWIPDDQLILAEICHDICGGG